MLLDRSELDAAVGEAQASLYIEMTRHTDDNEIKAAFLRFVEEVEPKIKDISFKIDRMIVQCPLDDDLDQDQVSGCIFKALEADVQAVPRGEHRASGQGGSNFASCSTASSTAR